MADGVKVKILGDDSDLQAKLKSASISVAKWGAATAVAAGVASAAMYVSTTRQIKELSNLAASANTSIGNFQKMAYGAKLFGIEQDKLGDILKDVNDRIGDFNATGGGEMADFFENIAPKVGVTADQFKKLSGPEALQLYVSSLEKANLSQADMTFYMEAVASNSTRLIPLLKNGGKAMSELSLEAEKLGLALSDIDAAKVESASDSMSKMGSVVGGAAQAFAVQFAPVVDAVADKLFDAAKEADGFKDSIDSAFSGVIWGAGQVGDAVARIQIAIKGAELGFDGLSAVVANRVEGIVGAWDAAKNKILKDANQIIRGANAIPGVDIAEITVGESESLTKIKSWSKSARSEFEKTAGEFVSLMNAPLPSDSIDGWVKEAQDASQKAAEAMVKSRESIVAPSIDGEGGGASNSKLEAQKEEAQKNLDAVSDSLKSEAQLRWDAEDAAFQALIEARDLQLITKEEYLDKEAQLNQKYIDEDISRKEKAASDELKIAQAANAQKLSYISGTFGALSSLMNTENRKLFEIGKAAAIAQATVDGFAAVQKTMASVPYPFNIPLAAAQGVAAAANVAKISSTSFGGGGGGAATLPSGGTSALTGGGVGGGSQFGGSQSVNLSLQGDTFSRQSVESLIEELNEAVANGARIRVS